MRNKTGIIILTVILTALCVFFISFSFVERSIRKDATEFATNEAGQVDFAKKQNYLDSIYNKPVYNFLGLKEYTYKEVQQNGLNLGLDLQGGMHVTLEVSPVEILKGLAGNNSQNEAFVKAIDMAKQMQRNSQENFTTLFYRAYNEIAPQKPLADIFANYSNREYVKPESTDQEVQNYIEREVDQAIDRTFQIIRTRIDRFGVTSPNIQRIQGTGRIQVELPGADNPERVRNLLQGVAKLEFLEVWQIQNIQPYLMQINEYLVSKQKAQKAKSPTQPSQQQQTGTDLLTEGADPLQEGTDTDTALTESPAQTDTTAMTAQDSLNEQVSPLFTLAIGQNLQYGQLMYPLEDTAKINDIFADPKVQAMLPPNLDFLWEKAGQNQQVVELVPVKKGRLGKAPLTGEAVEDARADFAATGGGYEISMTMNATGAKKWKNLTRKAVETSTPQNRNRIAIVLDNVVYSAPFVNEEIPSGVSSISGNFTEEEAKDLANVLKTGKLPAPARIVEEGIIGPSLGQEAISQGLISTIAGLVLVVIFMVLYYSAGGFVANLALLFNIFFIFGILAQLHAALTLPGIAGIVLTIGMAVDANVLIFERVREELRAGKSVQQAIKDGYGKAFSAIFDSNITTILIGVILYWLGSGPVQGFATVLVIGIATSFFSAVFISRLIIEWMANRKMLSENSFHTFISKSFLSNINLDFISKRKKAYVFSSVIIVAGAVALLANGLNLGVDFRGGRSYIVQFSEPVVASEVKTSLIDHFENKGTEAKTYGDNRTLKITTSYLIDDESTEADQTVKAALEEGLKEFSEANPKLIGSEKVGATIADDILSASIISVLFSFIAIFLYVFFRFRRWQFGLGALIALAHDVLICISIYAIATALGFSLEVDQIFIAAILTVIGYSVNDTVVVFDRIRENMENNPRKGLSSIMNTAINDTMSRTIITALTVFIVVVILFIFGGEVLRGFALVLIVGSIFGTYSSVYIATPVVLDFGTDKSEIPPKKESFKSDPIKA